MLLQNALKARSGWGSILLEGGSSSVTRLQMFVWTWIGIFIYLTVFFGALYTLTLSSSPTQFNEVSLPDIDPTLVVLMGISQGSLWLERLRVQNSASQYHCHAIDISILAKFR
jgi:hypothetical protein